MPTARRGFTLYELLVTVVVLDRIACLVSGDRGYRTLVVVLALFGWGALVSDRALLQLARHVIPLDGRPIAPYEKFTVVGANQVSVTMLPGRVVPLRPSTTWP